jgi:Fe-Mn family superoxide dismutase
MSIELPALPYKDEALVPHISKETLQFHYGKHHAGYVTKLNGLIAGTPFSAMSLDDIVRKSDGAIFNNAAQIWNHTFYWNSLSPTGGGNPKGKIDAAITKNFGSFDKFKEQFTAAATGFFGSGWAWLVETKTGDLKITTTANAGCPMTEGMKPILTCDVWEHAYYIDFRNARPDYVNAFWKLVNWDFANLNLG